MDTDAEARKPSSSHRRLPRRRSPMSSTRRLSAFIGGCIILLAVAALSYVLLDLRVMRKEAQPLGAGSASVQLEAQSPVNHSRIRFTDVTEQAGIRFIHEAGARGQKWYPETIGAGGGFFDYDGDGREDILLLNGRPWPESRQPPEPTMRLYRNLGDGTFADVTEAAGLNVPLYAMGFAAADYDNDGDQDLVVSGY